jgi:hypothetical protein
VIPQPPQLSGSVPFVTAQLPLGHIVVPAAQLEAQVPALQTSPSGQTVVHVPQWLLSDDTQAPLQTSSPGWHRQAPL